MCKILVLNSGCDGAADWPSAAAAASALPPTPPREDGDEETNRDPLEP
jgi:hypothetical protein